MEQKEQHEKKQITVERTDDLTQHGLSQDICTHLFTYCDPLALLRLAIVCRLFHSVYANNAVWAPHLNFTDHGPLIKQLLTKENGLITIYRFYPLLRNSVAMIMRSRRLQTVWPEILAIRHGTLQIPLEQFNSSQLLPTTLYETQENELEENWFEDDNKLDLIFLLNNDCFMQDAAFLRALIIAATKYPFLSVCSFVDAFVTNLFLLKRKGLDKCIKDVVIDAVYEQPVPDIDHFVHLHDAICALTALENNTTINVGVYSELSALLVNLFHSSQVFNPHQRLIKLFSFIVAFTKIQDDQAIIKLLSSFKKHGFGYASESLEIFLPQLTKFMLFMMGDNFEKIKQRASLAIFEYRKFLFLFLSSVEKHGFKDAGDYVVSLIEYRNYLMQHQLFDPTIALAEKHGFRFIKDFINSLSKCASARDRDTMREIFIAAEQHGLEKAGSFIRALESHQYVLKKYKMFHFFLSLVKLHGFRFAPGVVKQLADRNMIKLPQISQEILYALKHHGFEDAPQFIALLPLALFGLEMMEKGTKSPLNSRDHIRDDHKSIRLRLRVYRFLSLVQQFGFKNVHLFARRVLLYFDEPYEQCIAAVKRVNFTAADTFFVNFDSFHSKHNPKLISIGAKYGFSKANWLIECAKYTESPHGERERLNKLLSDKNPSSLDNAEAFILAFINCRSFSNHIDLHILLDKMITLIENFGFDGCAEFIYLLDFLAKLLTVSKVGIDFDWFNYCITLTTKKGCKGAEELLLAFQILASPRYHITGKISPIDSPLIILSSLRTEFQSILDQLKQHIDEHGFIGVTALFMQLKAAHDQRRGITGKEPAILISNSPDNHREANSHIIDSQRSNSNISLTVTLKLPIESNTQSIATTSIVSTTSANDHPHPMSAPPSLPVNINPPLDERIIAEAARPSVEKMIELSQLIEQLSQEIIKDSEKKTRDTVTASPLNIIHSFFKPAQQLATLSESKQSIISSDQTITDRTSSGNNPTLKQAKLYFLKCLKQLLEDPEERYSTTSVLVEIAKLQTQLHYTQVRDLDVTDGWFRRVDLLLKTLDPGSISSQVKSDDYRFRIS